MLMLTFSILLLICFSCGKTQQNSDVIGCGGYIKSETDINYKVVRVNTLYLYRRCYFHLVFV